MSGTGPATRGTDAATRRTILRRHLTAFLRHLTPRRLGNFLLAETERLLGVERVRSLPYLLKIEPSNICNLRCPHCYDGRPQPGPGERDYGRMSLETFTRIVDEARHALLKINLYGFGEPFLFPETLEMIGHAATRNIGMGVSSNMHFTDPALPERIVRSGLEVLIVSCHGATPETHARFMRGGNMERAMANIRAVVEAKRRMGSAWPVVDWQYCVTGFNEHEIGLARTLASDLGVDRIRFIRPYLPADPGEGWESTRFPTVGSVEEGAGCSWLYRAAYVNWDGGVLPCCRDVRDTANDFGNLNREPLRAVWNNSRFRAARQLARTGQSGGERILCHGCPALGRRKGEG
jgi:MoaA/NifB/PqqE/SkfB family radical SAM enzyme